MKHSTSKTLVLTLALVGCGFEGSLYAKPIGQGGSNNNTYAQNNGSGAAAPIAAAGEAAPGNAVFGDNADERTAVANAERAGADAVALIREKCGNPSLVLRIQWPLYKNMPDSAMGGRQRANVYGLAGEQATTAFRYMAESLCSQPEYRASIRKLTVVNATPTWQTVSAADPSHVYRVNGSTFEVRYHVTTTNTDPDVTKRAL